MSAVLEHRPPSRMTLDEFLAWDSGEWGDLRWQLIDGEPVAMAPGRHAHGSLQGEVARIIGNHLLAAGRPCHVVTGAGIVPKLRSNENFRVPDLAITCAPPSEGVMVPDPVVLIEIMSPNDRAATRANLWAYATVPSVREILVLQSTRIEAELLRRGDDGNWPAGPEVIGVSGLLELRSIGFTAPLGDFYRTTYLAV